MCARARSRAALHIRTRARVSLPSQTARAPFILSRAPQDLLVAMLEEVSKQAAAQSGAVKKVVNMRKKRAGEDDDDEDDSDL